MARLFDAVHRWDQPSPHSYRGYAWLFLLNPIEFKVQVISFLRFVFLVVNFNVPFVHVQQHFGIPPAAFIHKSLIVFCSHSQICLMNISIAGSELTISCPIPNSAKLSAISLPLIPLCSEIHCSTTVLSSERLLSDLWLSRRIFDFSVKLYDVVIWE